MIDSQLLGKLSRIVGAGHVSTGRAAAELYSYDASLAVAVATVTGGSTEGLHRTFTHSLFTVAAVVIVFCAVAAATRRPGCWRGRAIRPIGCCRRFARAESSKP